MKKVMALSLALLSSMAVAEMNIDVQLNVAEKTIQKRCVFNPETQVWSMEQDDIKVIAIAQSEGDEVVMNLNVFKNDENGQPVLLSAPVIKAEWGKVAQVKFENENGESLSVEVVVTQ